ncbi:family 16 glycosylhydrolase [Ochrovirga pacifica]|uniref:family 16 glycosylhydrolase n=1 Tax=Ochrovirga pacifica TaxID=1042376 RepID=UPI000255A83D|nr:family 16 glycosylhydrolase [Ochrovirga pacifica]
MQNTKTHIVALFLIFTTMGFAQKGPYFLEGQAPDLEGKKWKLIKGMSDEFNKKYIDKSKWITTGGWIGRAPGLFQEENISQQDGSLQVTAKKLDEPIEKNGKKFTHGGAKIESHQGMTYGYYECRMKANKTFMSSTFWLINDKRGVQGCDRRTTELDIQECFGRTTTNKKFTQKFSTQMNSNLHSRDIPEGCDYKKDHSPSKGAIANGTVYDDYHVYGCWWKSKDEVWFFLDGKLVNKVTPPADFDLEMRLRMVIETYDWNPAPADGGMKQSRDDRTTYYDWVRSWRVK